MNNSSKPRIVSIAVLSLLIVLALIVLAFMTNTKRLEKIKIESEIAYIDVSYGIDYYRVDDINTINNILNNFNNTTLINTKATDEDFETTPIIMAFYDIDKKVVFSCEVYESGLYKNSRFYKYTENSKLDYDSLKNVLKSI